MSMSVRITSHSAVEDVETLLCSSESEDSEYDSAAEEIFLEGRDQLLFRTFPEPESSNLESQEEISPNRESFETTKTSHQSDKSPTPGEEEIKPLIVALTQEEEDIKPLLLTGTPDEEDIKPSLLALRRDVEIKTEPLDSTPALQPAQPQRPRHAESPVDFWTLPEPEDTQWETERDSQTKASLEMSRDSDCEQEGIDPPKRKTLSESTSDCNCQPKKICPAKRKICTTKSALPPSTESSPSKVKKSSLSTDITRWYTPNEEDNKPPPSLAFRPLRQPGPQSTDRRTETPLDFFRLFFTDKVIKTLVKNTNAYGSQKQEGKNGKWKDFSFEDMFSFLSIVIYMGLVKLPLIVDYWKLSRPYNIPFPRSVMSCNKFLNMCRSLHLCSLEADAQNQAARGTPEYDRLGKIKPLYTQIIEACKKHYQPNQNILIDERLVASKAGTSLKQNIKNKHTKWGYKLFVLLDTASGYTWNFCVYRGKSCSSGKGLCYDTVMALMDFRNLGTGYHLYVDDFYTSPILFRDLLENEVGACGRMVRKRVGFPKATENDLAVNAPRGTMRWIRDAGLLFLKWKDKREVVMCSTIHTADRGETICRRVKKGDMFVQVNIQIPSVVKDYYKHMGGVDLSDGLPGFYNVLHKTKKWYRTFFYHFVDIAIVNAYLLYKHHCKGQLMSQREFRDSLVQELADKGSVSTSTAAPKVPAVATHKAIYFSEGQDIPKGSAASVGRRKCSLCHRKTPVGCETCDVPLCFVPLRNCYSVWHKKHGL